MTHPTPSPNSGEIVALLLERIGQDFDGECHLTEEEAREAATLIEHLEHEKAELLRQLEECRTMSGSNIPAWSMRQAQAYAHTDLDRLFLEATRSIETWGAHPDLTSAQNLVGRAWNFVNRWIENGAPGASDKARQALSNISGQG